MDNQQLFENVKGLGLPEGEYAIFGSGPMGIRNLREMHDIDLIVSERVFNGYKGREGWDDKDIEEDGNYYRGLNNESLKIEMWRDWYQGWNVDELIKDAEMIEGLLFVRIEKLLEWKKLFAREKDLKDVALIEDYLSKNKRVISCLVPYKIKEGRPYFFLQKRSEDALRAPGLFGFFGGGVEGNEIPEEGLIREIKEEMDFNPTNYSFFGKYDLPKTIMHVFTLEVEDDFESKIEVLEGDYGKWFSEEDFENERKIIMGDLRVLEDLYRDIIK